MSHEGGDGLNSGPAVPRVEGATPSSLESKRTPETPDEETLRMLQEAGLDSSMVDPSSLQALQELCTPKQGHVKSLKAEDAKTPAMPSLKRQTVEETKENDALSAHVPSEVLRPLPLGRVTSDLTMGLRSESMVEEETDASTAGSTQRVTNMDKRILDQLQLQTALLMNLQVRVEELSQVVAQQQGQLLQRQQHYQAPPNGQFENVRNMPRPPGATTQEPRNAPQPPLGHQQQQEQAAGRQRHEMFIFQLFNAIPAYIRSTRMAELCRVYWALHRRDMGGRIDGNLILKVAFMAAILLSKFSSSSKRKKHGSSDRSSLKSTLQFYAMIFMIVGGFLVQSGYAQFLYNFVFKERYPQRIWNGEAIVVAEQRPPQARNGVQEAQQQEQDVPQGPGFLRGGIHEAPAQAGIVGKLVMDFVYLMGSFLLSILPMWKAEAQPRADRRGDANQRANEQEENDGGAQGRGNEDMD